MIAGVTDGKKTGGVDGRVVDVASWRKDMTSCLNHEMRKDEVDQTLDVGPQLKPRRCQNE